MISQPPTPWFDPLLYYLSLNCDKFTEYYYKDINVCRTYICVNCNKKGRTHFHHIIPRSNLGAHERKNIIELCPRCHILIEKEFIEINEKGKFFYWGLKKKHKIELKLFKNEINLNDINYNRKELNYLIRKHLSLDSAIKYLIKIKKFKEIEDLKKEWKHEGIIK